jgi:branched-chain amino acid transport system substrate-binding protein
MRKRGKNKTIVAVVMILMLLIMAACGEKANQGSNSEPSSTTPASNSGSSGSTGTSGTGTGPSQPQSSQAPPEEITVTIGLTAPLSGGAAQYGKDILSGLMLAIDEINEAGGVPLGDNKIAKLALESLDDRYLPDEAATNAKRLAQQSKAPIIFVPHSGGVLALQGFNTDPETTFLLGSYSSDPAVNQSNNPLTVNIPPEFTQYFEPFARKQMTAYGKRLGILTGTHAYAKQWVAGFSQKWAELGGEVLTDNSVDYNTTTDFSAAVAKAVAEKPDVMLIGGASQPTALVAKAARDQGFQGGFVVIDQAKLESMEKIVPIELLEGSVGTLPTIYYPGPGTQAFVEKFKKANDGNLPNAESALHYQTMHLFAKALELSGSTDPYKIREHIEPAIQALPGEYQPYGVYSVSPTGQLNGKLITAYVQNGKYVVLSEEDATGATPRSN